MGDRSESQDAHVRLTLVSHAMTDAMAASRFPIDEQINALGHREVAALAERENISGQALCGPEKRTIQTAELLGLDPTVEARRADLDYGRWRGCALSDVQPADLAVWLTEPGQVPHGGESVIDLVQRVAGWLDSLTASRSRIVAVAHPAVIRAAVVTALDAPPRSFWRIDIRPATRTVMHFRRHAWVLRAGQ